jgi:hypothetical protein
MQFLKPSGFLFLVQGPKFFRPAKKCAPDASLFEHFLPWIHNIMLAYREEKEVENDFFAPKAHIFSKAYYTKKVN